MIQLTNETKVITDNKFLKDKSKVGTTVDNSLYLVRIDENNLALQRNGRTLNYFGDVRTCLTRSLNYAIKGSQEALSLELIQKSIDTLDQRIKELTDEDIK